MGDPRRLSKKYETPNHPWQRTRIAEEKKLVREYGLKNKRELWRAQTGIRKYRKIARDLVALPQEEREQKEGTLLTKLTKLGLVNDGGTLDDILSLKPEHMLERRLQTVVWKKGMSLTPKQARQFITHGQIRIKGNITTAPGLIVNKKLEQTIEWAKKPIQLQPPQEQANIEAQDTAIATPTETAAPTPTEGEKQ